jgi:nucleotide-binding universal stress UspA family protein
MDRILVGVDGSPASTAAAVWAAGEAAMRKIELTIVHALAASSKACTHMEWPVKPLPDEVTNAVIAQGAKVIDDALEAVARGNRTQPPRITSRLVFGPVVPTLWEFTREGAQMIVLGRHSRGETHRARLGSVAVGMLQTARCPVTIVHHDSVSRLQASRAPVVVGADSSPTPELATAIAFDEAARRAVELVTLHTIGRDGTSADAHARGNAMHFDADYRWAHALSDGQARYPDVVVRRFVTADDPVRALLSYSRHAQLVVIGGTGHGSSVVNPFSRVSSAVAQACRIPVIVACRKPSGCQPQIVGDRRKIAGPNQ